MPSAILLLVEGAEEMEAVIAADVLRRAGFEVTIAGVEGTGPVVCRSNVVITPDVALSEAIKKDYDVVVCPGGLKGSDRLAASALVGALLKRQEERDGYIACICASSLALKTNGICKGKRITSHPLVDEQLKDVGFTYCEDRVVVDGKLVTSRAPGTAFEFALTIVELLNGKEKRDSLASFMLVKP